MKFYNLQYYVDKLKNGEKFSLARYGDGEFYCMWGRQGENSNGCRYSPELRQALFDSMNHQYDPTFIYGMQRVLPQDQARAEKEYPETDWHDSEFFSEVVAEGKLYPFIEQLRKMNVVVIGNKSIKSAIYKIFPQASFFSVPSSNAYDTREDFFPMNPAFKGYPVVYLYSCGMAANAFISEAHKLNLGDWHIDVGHIWDPFVGNMSRCDLEGKTMEEINRNLQP